MPHQWSCEMNTPNLGRYEVFWKVVLQYNKTSSCWVILHVVALLIGHKKGIHNQLITELTRLKSLSVYMRGLQSHQRHEWCTRIYESLTTQRNSKSHTYHSWSRSQTVSHPSTNIDHCRLTAVKRQILITLRHNS